MIPKQLPRQRDFSAGELVSYAKRADDDEFMRAGARTMRNWRILAKGFEQRPGRALKFVATGRTDEVRMSATAVYKLTFGVGTIVVRNSADTVVATDTGNDWALATVDQINWEQFGNDIFVTFPGQPPRVASWDGATAWTFADFAFDEVGGQLRAPFYRISAAGLKMKASALTGAITVTAYESDGLTGHNYFVAGMVGTRLELNGRQVTVTSIVSGTVANATVNELLFDTQSGISSATNLETLFSVGDVVEGTVSTAKGIIVATSASNLNILLTRAIYFTTGDVIVGPNGRTVFTAVSNIAQPAMEFWREEVANDYRGWPQSVFNDQRRLGFCDFPGLPEAISWSVINNPYDHWPGALADDAITELVPKKARVFHVAPGEDEFVLTDVGVWFIPISETNPLRPGSVAFRTVATEPASPVRPVVTPEGVLFVGEGLTHLIAIVGTGQTARPYITRNVSEFHAHLFTSIRAIASASGGAQFNDRYIYALNTDGTLAVGRFNVARQWVGWLPWTAALDGVITWVSARGSSVLTVTQYTINSEARSFVEQIDTDHYLDVAVLYNHIPAALPPPPGFGLLWWATSGTVDLLKDGWMPYGSRAVDATGNIVEQQGDDLTSATLVVGFTFTPTFEPFIPHAQPGQSVKQSQRKRSIGRMTVTVENSSGGFTVGRRRATTWRVGEDQAVVPPLREESIATRPLGRSYDPRIEIIKDVAGPLRILEVSTDVNV